MFGYLITLCISPPAATAIAPTQLALLRVGPSAAVLSAANRSGDDDDDDHESERLRHVGSFAPERGDSHFPALFQCRHRVQRPNNR